MTFSFTVPGSPTPKARPRFTKRGGVYTDVKTVQYEMLVRQCFYASKSNEPYKISKDKPILLSLKAYFPIPKSWPKYKQQEAAEGKIPHTVKPDYDNIAKSITDALNGLAWVDDSRVYAATVIKLYSENPRVEVTIRGEKQ